MTICRQVLFAALLLLLSSVAGAADWTPWDAPEKVAKPTSRGGAPFDQAIRFFQTTISRVDGDRCPMYPTCSAYARQAISRRGPWLGLMLTIDRLIHENDPAAKTKPIQVGDRLRYYDPVTASDFWLPPLSPAPSDDR
ncbi:MAG: hypothetical protein Tsb0017_02550 [Geothermobacteraceae bacterium]